MIGEQTSRSLVPKPMQLATADIDDPGIIAGKTFSVTSEILAKGTLINNKGKRELGMIAKNHEPNPLAL